MKTRETNNIWKILGALLVFTLFPLSDGFSFGYFSSDIKKSDTFPTLSETKKSHICDILEAKTQHLGHVNSYLNCKNPDSLYFSNFKNTYRNTSVLYSISYPEKIIDSSPPIYIFIHKLIIYL